MEHVITLLLIPIAFAVIWRGSDFHISLALLVSAIIEIIIALVFSRAYLSISWCICFTACAFVMLVEIRRYALISFVNHLLLKNALEENERMSEAMHANEMRHMIANVAHDLKTVSEQYLHKKKASD